MPIPNFVSKNLNKIGFHGNGYPHFEAQGVFWIVYITANNEDISPNLSTNVFCGSPDIYGHALTSYENNDFERSQQGYIILSRDRYISDIESLRNITLFLYLLGYKNI